MTAALEYVKDSFDTFVAELQAFLAIPSISTLPQSADDVTTCAEWLWRHLRDDMRLEKVELIATGGHPIVYAEHNVDPAKPTVLCYGHYDVQPVDPLNKWDTPPFTPTVKDGRLYARGAADDKGQMFAILKAVQAYLASDVPLPVNVKFVIEGEEEVGSTHFTDFVRDYKDKLNADCVLVCDTAMQSPEIPAITASLRGITYIEMVLTGPERDLHSGDYGGAVENPLHVLSQMIAGLHDDNDRVTIDGFYDDVREPDKDVRAQLESVPFDEKTWLETAGIKATRGESGFTSQEMTTIRPCLDVHGMWGGFSGPGAKAIIPSGAGAKLSARLVANQRANDVLAKLKRHLEDQVPEGMTLEMTMVGGADPVDVDLSKPAIQAAKRTLADVFGTEPVYLREGGSISAVTIIKDVLGLDSVMMGFGLDSDSIHAPNENFGLDRYKLAIDSVVRFFEEFGGSNA